MVYYIFCVDVREGTEVGRITGTYVSIIFHTRCADVHPRNINTVFQNADMDI